MVKWFLTLESGQFNEERRVFSINYAGSTRYHAKEGNILHSHCYTKINYLKMDQYQNGRVITMEHSEKKQQHRCKSFWFQSINFWMNDQKEQQMQK